MKAFNLFCSIVLVSTAAMAVDNAMPAAPAMPATPTAKGMIENAKGAATKASEGMVVNLNTATEADLQKVPGLNADHAKEIVSHRPYKSVNDLSKVKGITKDMIAKVKPFLSVK